MRQEKCVQRSEKLEGQMFAFDISVKENQINAGILS